MQKLFIVIFFLLFGCNWEEPYVEYDLNYDNAKEAALSAWEMQIGWISERCLKHLDVVKVIESTKIRQHCPSSDSGCMFVNPDGVPTNIIYVNIRRLNDDILKIAVHEYIHHIESCEYHMNYWKNNKSIEYSKRGMMHYNKAIWGIQKNSVEQKGNVIVLELSTMSK